MFQRLTTIAAGLTLASSALLAQAIGGQSFQQAGTLAVPGGRGGGGGSFIPAISARTVTGSPFSATEERRTTQTLGDGTVIENNETSMVFRDTQGRTRVERTLQGKTTITIVDPVAGTNVVLDPAAKTARKMPAFFATAVLKPAVTTPAGVSDNYAAGYAIGASEAAARGRGATATTVTPAELDRQVTEEARKRAIELAAQGAAGTVSHNGAASEDLGMLHQNGVPARGSRSTVTIPAGQIGNSREIRVVNERWYSEDLQLTIKSVNSDPRFGTTTYQLTNIQRTNPDSGLFQIPSDYTTVEGGGRGGRGGVAAPGK